MKQNMTKDIIKTHFKKKPCLSYNI